MKLMWSCLSAAAVLAGCGGAAEAPFAVGTLERDRIEVAAESREPITAMPFEEGAAVAAGTVLVVQDQAVLRARVAQARARLEEAVARLAEAQAGPRPQEIEQAEARLAAARSSVETVAAELRREQALVARDFAAVNSLDVLQGRHREALARQREAASALAELREGTRREELAQAREAAAAARAALEEQQIALARTESKAPVAATIEALPFELGERPGPGQTVAVLRASGPTYARIHLPEPLRTRVGVGTPAVVEIDGHPGSYRGHVRWVATEAAFTPYYALTQRDRSRLSYQAEVQVTAPEAASLPVGVPVQVRFPAGGSGNAKGTGGDSDAAGRTPSGDARP